MDKITTEILERLCNGDSHMRIAREMNIPESWIDDAVMAYNDPQGSADLVRSRGTKLHSDRIDKSEVKIV